MTLKMTHDIMTHDIMSLDIMTIYIMTLHNISILDTQINIFYSNAVGHYANCTIYT
jgi:hypothetical protein